MRTTVTVLIVLLTSPFIAADPSYPSNPQQNKTTLFLSHRGVTAYDGQSLKAYWTRLASLQTSEPTMVDDRLLVGSSGGLFALDINSGKTLWHYSTGKRLFSPSVKGSAAYAASVDGYLYKLDIHTGHLIWQQRLSDGWTYPPAIIDGRLISGGQDGVVRAVDASTGKPRWNYKVAQELVYRPVSTAAGAVIITTFAGKVYALDGHSGQPLWQQQHPVPSFSPVVGDGHIYLHGYDNRLRALAQDSGQLLWSYLYSIYLEMRDFSKGKTPIDDRNSYLSHINRSNGQPLWNNGGYRLRR